MPLVNPLPYIKKAQEIGVSVVAFNIHNMEMIQAVVESAVEENSPVIIQTTPGTLKHAGIPYIAAIVKTAAQLYDIPISLHLDHCPSFEIVIQCIRNGYNSVMIDGSHLPYKENVDLVKKVTEIAHAAGVAVEGEIGRIGGTEDNITVDEREAALTLPEEAESFVKATGVDTLAVAIGTAHGVYKGEPKLDFKRLKEIKALVDLPLVLHGASGVPNRSVIKSMENGICKVNIATELKIPMAEAIYNYFLKNPKGNDPRKYMGIGKKAVKAVVKEKIRLCQSNRILT